MSKRKLNDAPKSKKKGESSPTTEEPPLPHGPVNDPLLKMRTNITFQVNMDFYEKIEAIKEDSGFESVSELCREAIRRLIRKEAWANNMMNNYVKNRGGAKA